MQKETYMKASKLLIAEQLKLSASKVEAVITLLQEGATIPFMARYRKELTGGMDEVVLAALRDRHEQIVELDKRRTAITQSLQERDLLTPALQTALDNAQTLAVLEDIYLPFRPKRRTRAQIARERGSTLDCRIFRLQGTAGTAPSSPSRPEQLSSPSTSCPSP